MHLLYSVFIRLYAIAIAFAGLFNPKAKKFIQGRKNVFTNLQVWTNKNTKEVIWFHAASLGEFEQGRPLIEYLKKYHPQYAILLTFFSPSGYEVRKNYEHADYISYLPFDLEKNAKKFIDLAKPKMAFFIKYEFWHYYIKTLKSKTIPVFSVSTIFRENQVYFKKSKNFHNEILRNVSHFFVQDQTSLQLLHALGIKQSSITGDTRFDRVHEIAKQAQELEIIENFIDEKPVIVLGSIWDEDMKIIGEVLNRYIQQYKIIIAPHHISQENLAKIESYFSDYHAIRYSQYQLCCDGNFSILTIDNIGLLTSIYSYGNIAYVGGAFKTGLHNVLEPATFGLPVVFGSNYAKFKEAEGLLAAKGAESISTEKEFEKVLLRLLQNEQRNEMGNNAKLFVEKNTGATAQIIAYLHANKLL